MNKNLIISATALLCLVTASCHKKKESSAAGGPASPSAAQLAATYGFAAQTPKDVEAFVSVYGIKKLWHDLKASKAMASIRLNTSLQGQAAANPFLQGVVDQSKLLAGFQNLKHLLGDILGEETFVIFAPGSAERLKVCRDISNAIRIENFKLRMTSALSTKKEDQIAPLIGIYKNYGFSLHLPPMIFGGKVLTQKAALKQQLDLLEKNLPAGVEVTTFQLNGNLPFRSLVFRMSKLLPPDNQEKLKQFIGSRFPDPREAEDVFQSLMARKIEIAYGFSGDYLLVSVGGNHDHLKLASNFGDSLLSRPEMSVAAKFTGKPVLSLSWADKAFSALYVQTYNFSSLYSRYKKDLDTAMPGIDSKKLEADLARIDEKGSKAFPGDVDPVVGITYRDHGISSETYGGPKLHLFKADKPLKFAALPSESTFFWMDFRRDPAVRDAAVDWFEDIVSTGYDVFKTAGMPNLPDRERLGFAMFQNLALPKVIELYRITRDQFFKSFGSEAAMAVDLGGEMPKIPMIPQPVLENGKMLRLAVIKEVQDRKLLAQSWESYFKLAKDVALLIPQTSQMPGGLPEPKSMTENGVTVSYYPLPIATGDLLPNIAATDSAMVMSTSLKYSVDLAKAASAPAVAGQQPLAVDVRIRTKPACDFLDKWIAIAIANPELVFSGKPDKAEKFKKAQPAISASIQALRSVTGLESKMFEENGLRRTTIRIDWKE